MSAKPAEEEDERAKSQDRLQKTVQLLYILQDCQWHPKTTFLSPDLTLGSRACLESSLECTRAMLDMCSYTVRNQRIRKYNVRRVKQSLRSMMRDDYFGFVFMNIEDDSSGGGKSLLGKKLPQLPTLLQRSVEQQWEQLIDKWKGDFSQVSISKQLCSLIRKHGIPPDIRGQLWTRLTSASERRATNPTLYKDVSYAYSGEKSVNTQQIDKDLSRTHVGDVLFTVGEGRESLRRVLVAYSWFNPVVGYCQAMNFLAALFLLHLEEEDAFWMLDAVIDNIMPHDFYTENMFGVVVDMCVLNSLALEALPRLAQKLQQLGVALDIFMARWFLCLFLGAFPLQISLQVLDVLFCEGNVVMFNLVLGLLKLYEREVMATDEPNTAMELIRDLPSRITSSSLLETALSFRPITVERLEEQRRKVREALTRKEQSAEDIEDEFVLVELGEEGRKNRKSTTNSDECNSIVAVPVSEFCKNSGVSDGHRRRSGSFSPTNKTRRFPRRIKARKWEKYTQRASVVIRQFSKPLPPTPPLPPWSQEDPKRKAFERTIEPTKLSFSQLHASFRPANFTNESE